MEASSDHAISVPRSVPLHDPHVAIVIDNAAGTGAVARVAMNQAAQLRRHFEITIVTDAAAKDRDSNLRQVVLAPRRFDWMRRLCHVPNQLSFLWSAAKGLEKMHETHPIDFVWCHSHPVAAWPLHWFRRRHQVRYGMTVHGDIFERPPGTYDFWLTQLYKRATPRAYARATVTQVLAPIWVECAARRGLSKGRIVVIPNGISPSELGDPGDGEPRDDQILRILYVGRFSVEKGATHLLRSAKILHDRGVAYRLDLVGDGPELESLQSFVVENRLGGQVRFKGRIPRERLAREYVAADVLCVPSLSESLATVVLESLALGTPVVATNVGGNPYMIRDRWNGRLVPPRDPKGLAGVLEELAADPMQLKSLATQAGPSVADRFSWSRVGDQMAEAILESLRFSDPKP